WLRTQDSSDMATAMQGISWREPVKALDPTFYQDLEDAQDGVNAATVDGNVAVVAGDRILYVNIAGLNKNVYIVVGTPGSGATLVEDTNAASKGDSLYVNAGTSAGMTYNYNGTAWVQQGGASSTEIGFIKSFIGKSADGNETPTYQYEYNVTSGNTLEVAIDQLDNKLGSEGQYENMSGPWLISKTARVATNLAKLDFELMMARKLTSQFYLANQPAKVMDSVNNGDLVDLWAVTWKVFAEQTGGVWYGEVTAIQWGGNYDYNVSSILSLGDGCPTLQITVDTDGPILNLKAASTVNGNVYTVRSIVGDLA
ncbi:MAG: hypothetical protein H7835_17115, partial [Magnetococcus sp. XQGC-1]